MARLLFIRHGRTFRPDEPSRRIGRRTDLPLTAAGAAELASLAAYLGDQQISRMWSGRMLRSRQTAAIVTAAHVAPPSLRLLSLLDEIDHGPDENRVEAEVVARIGHAALAAWDERLEPPPGWTVDLALRTRGWTRLARAIAAFPRAETFVAVGSQGAIRLAVRILLPGRLVPRLRPGHCGVLDLGVDGAAAMIGWDMVTPEGRLS